MLTYVYVVLPTTLQEIFLLVYVAVHGVVPYCLGSIDQERKKKIGMVLFFVIVRDFHLLLRTASSDYLVWSLINSTSSDEQTPAETSCVHVAGSDILSISIQNAALYAT